MAWFRISFAEKAFLRILVERGLALDALAVEDGVAAMLAFYADHRAQHTRLDEDGDMLLLQWGDGQLGITRQMIRSGDPDSPVMQLSLSFDADDGLPRAGHSWHSDPTEPITVPSFLRGRASSANLSYEAC